MAPAAKRARVEASVDADAARAAQRSFVAGALAEARADYASSAAQKTEQLAKDVRRLLLDAPADAEPGPPSTLLETACCVPRPAHAAHAAVAYAPPAKIFAGGSWLSRTCLRGSEHLDVVAALPDGLIGPKDVANGRYLEKRDVYLRACARALRRGGLDASVSPLQGDDRAPIVIVRAPGARPVRVHAGWAADAATIKKLAPGRNNVRDAAGGADVPTRSYNACLLRDTAHARHVALIHRACSATPAVGDAVVLTKLWLRTNGQLGRRDGGATGFLASVVVVQAAAQLSTSSASSREDAALEIFRAAPGPRGEIALRRRGPARRRRSFRLRPSLGPTGELSRSCVSEPRPRRSRLL